MAAHDTRSASGASMTAPLGPQTKESEQDRIRRLLWHCYKIQCYYKIVMNNLFANRKPTPNFFQFAHEAIANDMLAKLAVILDEGKGYAFWRIYKANRKACDAALLSVHSSEANIKDYSARIKTIRDKILFHIDGLYDKKQAWNESKLAAKGPCSFFRSSD